MRTTRSTALAVVGLAITAMSLVACGDSSSCSDAQKNFADANSAVTDATTKLAVYTEDHNSDGVKAATADKKDAEGQVTQYKADVARLCTSSAAATTSGTPVPAGISRTADVTKADGSQVTLPVVDDNGTVIRGDSTTDPRTPASYADALKNGAVKSWKQLYDTMGGMQWYVDGVNARKAETGFDWALVKKFADTNTDARVIQVFNSDYTDQQARDAVKGLIGDDAKTLPIDRPKGCPVNTWGFKDNPPRMYDFVDCRKMVRVSLAAIEYDTTDTNKPVRLNAASGVFIDCFNLHWTPPKVEIHQQAASSSAAQTTQAVAATTTSAPTTGSGPSTSTPTRTTPATTTSAPPTSSSPPGGKNAGQMPVVNDPTYSDPRVRPNESTAPSTVNRTGSSYTAAPTSAQPTLDQTPTAEVGNPHDAGPQATATNTDSAPMPAG